MFLILFEVSQRAASDITYSDIIYTATHLLARFKNCCHFKKLTGQFIIRLNCVNLQVPGFALVSDYALSAKCKSPSSFLSHCNCSVPFAWEAFHTHKILSNSYICQESWTNLDFCHISSQSISSGEDIFLNEWNNETFSRHLTSFIAFRNSASHRAQIVPELSEDFPVMLLPPSGTELQQDPAHRSFFSELIMPLVTLWFW